MKFIKLLLVSISLIFFVWMSPVQASPLAQVPTPPPEVQESETSSAALIQELAQEYKPSRDLNYDRSRDQMFGIIDNRDGIVTDIYAGFSIRLTGDGDTSQEADRLGQNTEHVWPQSKGADKGNARSDLHHLFPSRKDVNSDRGNKPFSEIEDRSTEKWYRDDVRLRTIPNSEIDEFSESAFSRFEPREEVKGNIARAMFYFNTIYSDRANAVDPNYFERQRQTLCQWNQQDPPDTTEIERSRAIAEFQGNENPFVLDATLAQKTYCNS
ncbi:endonuclease I family protein [Scytonema hofmannii]|uniref:endonuclease I family protein n=1 Tax=Scytonema hofmannii TaxID=34078 RepID=UPI0003799C5E|nr:endonuclease [Scytonema hofmannii]